MARRPDPPPWKPDIDTAEWISAVREALDLTQTKLAEAVDAEGGRDTVAKWEAGVEPGFTYARRIATIAPKPLLQQFLGKSAASAIVDGVPDHDHKMLSEGNQESKDVDKELEAAITLLTAQLKSITDPALRRHAATEAMNAITKACQNPPEPPKRAPRKSVADSSLP